MMGRLAPVMGAVTRMERSTMRPGYGKTRGLTEITGVAGVVGSFAASPIKAWSFGARDVVVSVAMMMVLIDFSKFVCWSFDVLSSCQEF
jgi:hypothetical protein